MRHNESIAKALVERVIPRCRMDPVLVQSSNEWDFDLIRDSTATSFEVTRSTSQTSESLYAAIFGRNDDKQGIPRVRAQHPWLISVSRLSDVRKFRRLADELISKLEAEGLVEFDVAEDMASPAVHEIWETIRAPYGCQVSDVSYPDHLMLPPSDGAMLSSDQVVAAVQREVDKPDNVSKLGRSASAERHLFVMLGNLSYPATNAMRQCGLPASRLTLPAEITHIWVGTHFGLEADYLLWRFDNTSGWTDLGTVTLGEDR